MAPKRLVIIITIFLTLCAGGLFFLKSSYGSMTRHKVEAITAHVSSSKLQPFPQIDETNLSVAQKNIIQISRTEYAKKPVSYDEHVLKYSNGNQEPWCADYLSWVMREAGAPLANPNSGGWRIPGVLTLREYYKSNNRFKDAREYTPRVGDAAIFVNTTSFNTSKQHTSIVLKVEGDQVTTIGGNEQGRLRVKTHQLVYGEKGLVGFGTLPL